MNLFAETEKGEDAMLIDLEPDVKNETTFLEENEETKAYFELIDMFAWSIKTTLMAKKPLARMIELQREKSAATFALAIRVDIPGFPDIDTIECRLNVKLK